MTKPSQPSLRTSSGRNRSRIGSRTVARSSTSATRRSTRSRRRTSPISRASGASISGRRWLGSTPARLSRSSTTASPTSRPAPATFSRWTSRAARRSGSTKASSSTRSRPCAAAGRVAVSRSAMVVSSSASWTASSSHWTRARVRRSGPRAVGDWRNGETITSAPLYYDGLVITGLSGGEFGIRGSVTALRRRHRQGGLALLHDPRPGRDRSRDVAEGQRLLEARGRSGLADAGR